ncbi:MAG: dodecin domain-containing protein, partial [Balneolaceae bacterium]
SSESWEKAAANAVNKAARSLRNLRIAEVKSFDVKLNNDKVEAYRVRMNVSFKYEGD